MQKTMEKDIFKILALILAVLIAFTLIVSVVLIFTSEKGSNNSAKTVESTELKSILPGSEEMKISEQIKIGADGSSEKTEGSKKDTNDELADDYIIADSNSKILTSSDVAGLSAKELNYAKNEIYARHGRKFSSNELQTYFESKSWYEGKYEPSVFDSKYSESVLTDIEKKNSDFLREAEEKAGGYELD